MDKKVSEMTKEEFLELIDYITYQKSRRANDQLFKGLFKFINQLLEDNRMILEELENIKALLKVRNAIDVNEVSEKVEEENESNVIEENEFLGDGKNGFDIYSKLDDETKEKLKNVLTTGQYVNRVQVQKPKIPKLKD
ncbi:hypothetical protein NSQ41_12795 [Aeribacillus sp. FSL K6-8210]|uniref:hypothetical protein n=1 Tax=Aeribacillus sp. FSL K6-8210 TaxID=2954683 RepID=UPI0030D01549